MISVDTATDFFSYLSVSVSDDGKFIKDLNKFRDILEDSFVEDPEAAYVYNFMSALESNKSNDDVRLIKYVRGDGLK